MKTILHSPIRKILVPLDTSDYTRSATNYACKVAQDHQAKITGLAVLDTPEIRSVLTPYQYEYGYFPAVEERILRNTKNAEDALKAVEVEFTEYCTKKHQVSNEVLQEGVPVDLITEAATLFDLMVVGLRTFFHFETRNYEGEQLHKILNHGATPVLAVPKEAGEIKRVLITYDGSPASARAVRDFVIFGQPMDIKVDLFLADKDIGQLGFHANKLCCYLNDHGMSPNEVIKSTHPPLDAIENGMIKNYDLVVAGMHARRPIRDFFVGSFTRKLMEIEESALFLSH